MLSFSTAASIAASPSAVSDPRLRELLAAAIQHWKETELLDLTHLVIVQPGDTEKAIVEETGLSPLVNPIDGARFGSAAFQPYWDLLIEHGDSYELTVTIDNSGRALVLLIANSDGVDPELRALCRTYATRRGERP